MNDVLNGRFTIIETVSEDRLYKAVDTATGQMAAVKKWVNGDSASADRGRMGICRTWRKEEQGL